MGYGGIYIYQIFPRIKEEYFKKYKQESIKISEKSQVQNKKFKKANSGVKIEGIDNCLIKFSKCCNPLPGDRIIGFITRGHGVSIHKIVCSNVPKNISECQEPQRWVGAHWVGQIKNSFKSTLEIIANDRTGLLADLTIKLSSMHIHIHSFNSRKINDKQAVIYAIITINGIEHLNLIISKLKKINGIISIRRT